MDCGFEYRGGLGRRKRVHPRNQSDAPLSRVCFEAKQLNHFGCRNDGLEGDSNRDLRRGVESFRDLLGIGCYTPKHVVAVEVLATR